MASAHDRKVPFRVQARWLWDHPTVFLLGLMFAVLPIVQTPFIVMMSAHFGAEFERTTGIAFRTAFLGGACVNLAFGACCLGYVIRATRRKTLLYRKGTLTAGTLLAMEAPGAFLFSPFYAFKVRYRFSGPDRKELCGSSKSRNVALINGAKQGDPVDVLFLKARPEINCLAEEMQLLKARDQCPSSPRAETH